MKYYFCLIAFVFIGYSGYSQHDSTRRDTLKKNTTIQLDSVIVFNTGYQSVSKVQATGSFTQVDNHTLNLQVGSNILSRLGAVTTGVSFSKKNSSIPAIAVRGLSTINGPTSPLIILDNFPFEGDISSINPNLIESITVLKDATAASIWGTRAGNGVIVINTKKGKFSQPITIDLNANTQVVTKPDLFYSKPIAVSDYIDVEQFLFSKGYYNGLLTSISHPAVSPIVDVLDQQARGLISSQDAQQKIDTYRNIDTRNEFSKYVYDKAVNQQYAINFSGGSAQSSWSTGGGYDHNISELSQQYERWSSRLENSYRPINNLRINSSISYTSTKGRSGMEGYNSMNYLYPYSPLVDANGRALSLSRDYRQSYTDTLGTGKLLDWNYYPLEDYKHSYTNNLSQHLLANVGLQYQILTGLNLDYKYQYEYQTAQNNTLYDNQSFFSRYYVNLFSQINNSTGVVTYIVPKGGILDRSSDVMKATNFREQLNFNRKFKRYQLSAVFGNEIREVRNTSGTYRTYGYDPEIVTGGITDFKNRYPVITTGDLNNIPGGENLFDETVRRYVSFYGNAALTYRDCYNFTLSARRDASNLFGVNTNQKWTPLWSAGLGWDISKEPFYKFSMLPYLKLRATYGYTGNADPNRSAVITIYSLGNSLSTGLPGARVRQYPNPTLRWEQVAITNIGLDFSLENNRLSGSMEWYWKKGIDLFGNSPVDITTGLNSTSVTKNIAGMKGTGIDIFLNSINTKGKLGWTTGLIFNYNSDKVTKAYLTTTNADRFIEDGNGITAIEGRPVHSLISYKWAGLDPLTGDPQGYVNGVVSKDYNNIISSGTAIGDLQYSGPALPRFFGSLTNSLNWKGLELNINISYKFQYFFKRKPLIYGDLFATDKKSTNDFANRWQNPGDENFTDVPSMQYPANGSRDYFYASSATLVEKGDHVRLEFINLSYQLNLKSKENKRATKMVLYVNANNLGILWRANKRGIDPDYALSDIPQSRAYAIGFKFILQ